MPVPWLGPAEGRAAPSGTGGVASGQPSVSFQSPPHGGPPRVHVTFPHSGPTQEMVSELLSLFQAYQAQGKDSPAGQRYLAYVEQLRAGGVNVESLLSRLAGEQRPEGPLHLQPNLQGLPPGAAASGGLKQEGVGQLGGRSAGQGAPGFPELLGPSQNLPSLALPPDFEAQLARRPELFGRGEGGADGQVGMEEAAQGEEGLEGAGMEEGGDEADGDGMAVAGDANDTRDAKDAMNAAAEDARATKAVKTAETTEAPGPSTASEAALTPAAADGVCGGIVPIVPVKLEEREAGDDAYCEAEGEGETEVKREGEEEGAEGRKQSGADRDNENGGEGGEEGALGPGDAPDASGAPDTAEASAKAKRAAKQRSRANAAGDARLVLSNSYLVPRQGLIRRIVLLLDSSKTSRFPSPELNSAYAGTLYRFVQGLFAESPLSELALITLQDGKAYVENGFSNSIFIFREIIQNMFVPSGTMSLQAGLSISHELFRQLSPQMTKEVIFINFSSSTIDAGNLEDAVERLRLDDAIFHAVCMGACISVLKNISRNCREGGFEILDAGDMEGLEQFLAEICRPPNFLDHRIPEEHRDRYIVEDEAEVTGEFRDRRDRGEWAVSGGEQGDEQGGEQDDHQRGDRNGQDEESAAPDAPDVRGAPDAPDTTRVHRRSTQLRVGFPTRYTYSDPTPCFCHGRDAEILYRCPGCGAYLCNTSTCPVCKLYLIIYPTLARSALSFRETWKSRHVPLFSPEQLARMPSGPSLLSAWQETRPVAPAPPATPPTHPFKPVDPAKLSCCLCALPVTMRQAPFPMGRGKPLREDKRTAFYGLCEKCGSVYCSHCAGFCEAELQQCIICGGSDVDEKIQSTR